MATLFERIISGELPAKIVFKDDRVTAFRDIRPRAPVHILVVPNKAIATVNEIFSPARDQWERAESMLAAYEEAHRNGAGAAMFEGEMIDEANRKMAERIALAGRAAGYER